MPNRFATTRRERPGGAPAQRGRLEQIGVALKLHVERAAKLVELGRSPTRPRSAAGALSRSSRGSWAARRSRCGTGLVRSTWEPGSTQAGGAAREAAGWQRRAAARRRSPSDPARSLGPLLGFVRRSGHSSGGDGHRDERASDENETRRRRHRPFARRLAVAVSAGPCRPRASLSRPCRSRAFDPASPAQLTAARVLSDEPVGPFVLRTPRRVVFVGVPPRGGPAAEDERPL